MIEFSSDELISRTRVELGLDASVNAKAWRVQRIDRENQAYYLITFEENNVEIAIAAVNALTGTIQNSATLAEGGSPLSIDSEQATMIAGFVDYAEANLVWKPCRASLSPLYPLWEIRTVSETVYVDQQGIVWPALEEAGPGG